MRIDTTLDDVLEDLLRLRHQLDPVIRTMRDNMAGQPGAQSFDTIARGARSVHWCWDHEREVAACHKRGDFCTGESVPTDDPTGEAACDVDQVRDDHRHTVKDIQALRVISDRLLARFVRYQRRAATEKERQVTQRANEPGCRSCDRVGADSPRAVGDLCDFCRSYQRETSRLPSAELLKAKHAGKGREVQRLIARGA